MKILVSFSGGKDSQACLIQAFKQYGGGNLTAVFCDTGWEHPDTYKHVNDVCLQMGVRLITLKSKYDFVSLAAHKKRFPSTNARFCTSELKMKPMIDYVLSLKESCIIIQGIRAGESTARAAMEEECMYFKSYFQPNKKGRTENYRSKDVKEWCSQYDASVLRPIFKWSAQQVIDCILDAGQIVDPQYGIDIMHKGGMPKHLGFKQYKRKDWDKSPPGKKYFEELFRVSKNQIIFGGNYFTTYLPPKMGWIVWDKGQHGLTMSDGELAWSSFDKALRIITLNRCTIGERGGNIHRCQKPVKLYAEILRKNAKEGDKIFDSHLGSGSSRIAAYGLGFDFYATEIDEEYFEAQEERFHRECFGEIKTERGRLVQTNLFDK